MQYFPDDAIHAVTCMFDSDNNVVQWYVDICADWGVGADGVPWFDDLYLDVSIRPGGDVRLLDADELDAALADGLVSKADYDIAWSEARHVLQLIEQGRFPLIELSLAEAADVWNSMATRLTSS